MYIAHKTETSEQPLEEHLRNTAETAKKFADVFGSGNTAYLTGFLHDYGKYTDRFQRRIGGENITAPHAIYGAIKANRDYQGIGKLMAYCIAGHHAGLPNGCDATENCLTEKLKQQYAELYNIDTDNITPDIPKISEYSFGLPLYVRMLLSCLVDADYLDTEHFMNPEVYECRPDRLPLKTLLKMFDAFMSDISKNSEKSEINNMRANILKECVQAAAQPQGLFSLSVPTGGGKTLSSMAFALRHAVANGKSRIIYVIPYTSIIEQTSAIFRNIFGDKNVLEHHSGFDFTATSEDENSRMKAMKLASENWDASIIVTTSVQFFESFFSNRPSKCRKLHNVADSVIIFDEAQLLPYDLFLPCISLIKHLTSDYGCSAVLCTATQPVLDSQYLGNYRLNNVKEIIGKPSEYFDRFKRTEIVNIGKITDSELTNAIKNENASLTIVNTRKHAYQLYDMARAMPNSYHLSTLMCPAHRRSALASIKDHLDRHEPCTVVSTQLIEAGVDIDFPAVFRAMTGIDSIAQSAGRCNRNGNLQTGTVRLFTPAEIKPHKSFLQYIQTAEEIVRNYSDILSPDAVGSYFERLYKGKGSDRLDKYNILCPPMQDFHNFDFQFRYIAEKFHMIEQATVPVIIQYDEEARSLVNDLRYSGYSSSILRRLQKYTVQIYEHELSLVSAHMEHVKDIFVADEMIYDMKTGLNIFSHSDNPADYIH